MPLIFLSFDSPSRSSSPVLVFADLLVARPALFADSFSMPRRRCRPDAVLPDAACRDQRQREQKRRQASLSSLPDAAAPAARSTRSCTRVAQARSLPRTPSC